MASAEASQRKTVAEWAGERQGPVGGARGARGLLGAVVPGGRRGPMPRAGPRRPFCRQPQGPARGGWAQASAAGGRMAAWPVLTGTRCAGEAFSVFLRTFIHCRSKNPARGCVAAGPAHPEIRTGSAVLGAVPGAWQPGQALLAQRVSPAPQLPARTFPVSLPSACLPSDGWGWGKRFWEMLRGIQAWQRWVPAPDVGQKGVAFPGTGTFG